MYRSDCVEPGLKPHCWFSHEVALLSPDTGIDVVVVFTVVVVVGVVLSVVVVVVFPAVVVLSVVVVVTGMQRKQNIQNKILLYSQ